MKRRGRSDLLHDDTKLYAIPAKPHTPMRMIAITASEEWSAAGRTPRPNTTTGKRRSNLQIGMLLERCFSIHGRDRSKEVNNEGDVGKREGCEIE